MKYKQHIIAIALYYCCLFQTLGQIPENIIPLSAFENLPAITHFENLPSIDNCKEKDTSQELTKFACPIFTDLDPNNSGLWTETAGGKVWRLGIRSENAYSLYINMRFLLSPGVQLFVYGPDYQDLRGAFTSKNNNSAEILSVAPVRGDKIIIELNLPSSQHSFGKLKITKVYHDFINIFKDSVIEGRKSGNCEEDINCTNGRYWQTEKRAVCKIISGGLFGTGTLIGNTSGNNTPYVLTAYHIISSAEQAAEALFLFNYETSGCQGELASNTGSISGATLLATTDHRIDFALMQLFETPPPSYQTYYAGWDARKINAQKGICIHHPFGGLKQIAIEYHPLEIEDIGKNFDSNSTMKVSHWEVGTTELGSSGAPLFNESHRLVGTLTGGRSTCGYPRDDYFTRFGVAWDTYPASSNQLKHWLDPAQTGQLVLDGYDPYGFNVEHCDTAWNFFSYDKPGLYSTGLSWGWISGHNSAAYTQFAERYEPAGVLQINGVYLKVAKAYAAHPLAHIELKVWEGTQYPEKERFSKLLYIKDFQPDKVHFVSFDTVLRNPGPLFIGYKVNYNAVSDTFALYHAHDRGYKRPSSMYVYNGAWYQTTDQSAYGISTSLGLGISECYGKSRTPSASILNVYPNPCSNSITLDLPGSLPILQVLCFDNHGKPVPVVLRQTETDSKLYFDLPQGIYYVKIITSEKSFSTRFIVMK